MANLSGLTCMTHNSTAFDTGAMPPTVTLTQGQYGPSTWTFLAWDEPLLDVVWYMQWRIW